MTRRHTRTLAGRLGLAWLAAASCTCSHARPHPADSTLEATAGLAQAMNSADAQRVPATSVVEAAAADVEAQVLASINASIPSFGNPTPIARYTCPDLQHHGSWKSFLAAADTRVAFVDGDDWLALVNRSPTGALPPDYAPSDLVDLRDGRSRTATECASRECLRRDAASALHELLEAMRAEGLEGHVQSAFRAFATQCWVFASWAHQARHGFCEASEQSALPGHSQHQLGTTLDLFTKDWADEGARTGQGVFRNGFACSRGGTWLAERAWRFGFIVSYPPSPENPGLSLSCLANAGSPVLINPKTGYKGEPWHLRFIGVEPAARYRAAWLASGPGTSTEITLEQWLRAERGFTGDAELPVCDGCNCSACATLANDEARTPCGKAALWLNSEGHVFSPAEEPDLLESRASVEDGGVLVEATVRCPAHTPTQTPIMDQKGPIYGEGSTFLALSLSSAGMAHRYEDLPGAWRLAVEPVSASSLRWPWRASLASPEAAPTWNRANVILPARAGDITVRMRIALPGAQAVRVALVRNGVARDTRELIVQ